MLQLILEHEIVFIAILSWLVAQLIKVFLFWVHHKRANWSLIIAMGGMPSSHTTTVCALATAIGILEGTGSTAFAIALSLAAIVTNDAAGVRQTVSTQSVIINRILDELFKGNPTFEHRLRELIGHTKIEVLSGAILGVGIAFFSTLILRTLAAQ